MTDVLGVCESWADGVVLVRREDGTTVSIRTADIVSGKPVPPRPSPRLRVSTREAEGHASPHWPGVLREPFGEWELRTEPEPRPEPGGRLRKRANSCLAIGDPGVSLTEAESVVAGFYAARARPAMVQVETDSDVARWFEAAGWTVVPGSDSLFMLGSASRARRLLGGRRTTSVERRLEGPRARASVGDLADAKAAVDGDWLGFHGLYVATDARGQGLARAVLAELLDWGVEQGATTAWLHVETDNLPAIALYESIGLQAHHACRYLIAPAASL